MLCSPPPSLCQQVLANLTKNHKRISIWSSSADIVYCLASQLEKIPTVKILQIHETPLTENCLHYLSKNETLEGLGIFSSSIDDELLDVLCKFLQQNTTLTHLNLDDNPNITHLSVISLYELLHRNLTLTHSSLCDTSISSSGIEILLNVLKTNKTLKKLELDVLQESFCLSFRDYEQIKDRLSFVNSN